MAILFTQPDGSDQHYDTYEEFEQAFILLKRLNGEKVPQDLLDEVKAKNGDKDTEPLQVKIDGNNFESAFREAIRDVGEELDKLSKDRTPESDEEGNDEINGEVEDDLLPVGTQVKLLSQSFCRDLQPGDVGTITDTDTGCPLELVYSVRVRSGIDGYGWVGRDGVEVVEEDSPTEFRAGDIVRATEDVVGFGGQYFTYSDGDLLEVQTGGTGALCLVKDSWKGAYVSENLANIELVCRKEDRKDIEL